MNRLRATLKEHRHFIVAVALLTLVMTFPVILYVFKTDAFYLPADGSYDIFIHLWDVWYWKQILSGAADRSFTTIMFYPQGVSLAHHPFSSMPVNTLQIALQLFMPVSNAFNVAYLLVVGLNALSAYVYGLWLFKDKWSAIFAAAVFGFAPHVLAQPFQLHDATIAPVAIAVYCFHRGVAEERWRLIVAAGLVAGLTSTITLYSFSCVLITLAACVCALGIGRWREIRYWKVVGLLALLIAATSVWIVQPMMADSDSLDAALDWESDEVGYDLISAFVNHRNPFFGPPLEAALQPGPSLARSKTSYVGFLPIALLCLGLASKGTRRKMLPWLVLGAGFFVLRLGSTLHINGVAYSDILLPKYYLNEILPSVFKAFRSTQRFQVGLLLPLSVLAGYGIVALRARWPAAARPSVIVALIVILAFEYYAPLRDRWLEYDRFAYIAWLEAEAEDEVRLVHLPMGRTNSKQYMLFQSISGFPHAEGAISRTPDQAFDYIRANPVLEAWNNHRPASCVISGRERYLAGVTQLQTDGFSHIVHHRDRYFWERQIDSFRNVAPVYHDEYVDVYRLEDLRASCPE